ncbi:MAG: uracil-DNA glycosylase [Balneolaceae bacterium]|nr:MAG: uracil-DNA glycosylase [Balneolaceae bacterium]
MNQETLSKISHSGEEIGPAPGVHPVDIPVSNAARENQPDTIPSPGSPINIPAPVNRQHSLEDQLMSCSGLDELLELCNSADELKTDLENTRLVFGTGNPNADLMLIGEAPGEQEDLREEPFVGAAGQLLNKILEAIQFKREDVYIANILKHRPPGNRNPEPEERTRSLPYLIRQIELIQPKLILCLGKVSGNTLLNHEEPLKSMRGRFYPFKGAELTVTYHPAALLRNPHWKRPVWEDVQKLRKRYDELGCKP